MIGAWRLRPCSCWHLVFHVDFAILIGANLHAHAYMRDRCPSQRLHRHGGIEIAARVSAAPINAIRGDMLASFTLGPMPKRCIGCRAGLTIAVGLLRGGFYYVCVMTPTGASSACRL